MSKIKNIEFETIPTFYKNVGLKIALKSGLFK